MITDSDIKSNENPYKINRKDGILICMLPNK
jgi:hypothetical protein